MTVQVEYLVVAGGGGGGAGGGGGGGGGVLTGTSAFNLLTNYAVTVGTGGAGGPLNSPSGAAKGGNSVFSDQTALGGGSGGGPNTGGSGGGGGYGYGLTGGAGTAGQGNNGGNGIASGNYGGGGGGGAGGVGQNAPSSGGAGGLGFTSSISGSAVDYGGGGGGGQSGTGNGGGGNGGQGDSTQGTEGAINRGGGGGGGGNGSTYAIGKNGGSGVVILKYPNTYSITNSGGGLTYSTSTAVSGYKITTFTGGTGNIQFEEPTPNALADRFFPDVYFNLINNYTGTKKYIDGTNGSNSNNGDTVTTAYATIDYAITSNTSSTPTMFVIMEGTYTMTAVSTGDSVTIRDGGNERVFVCCPGRTIVQWTATTADRDAPMVRISNANSAIYGGIFRRNNNGRTTNYTVAYWKGQTRGNYYNCVFSETNVNNAWSYQYDNYGQNNLALRNCTFFNGAAPSGNYTNAGTCLTIDSVFNTSVTTGGTETNVLKSQTVNATTYVTSGVTTAGVYSGTYSWSAEITVPVNTDPGLFAPESVVRGQSFDVLLNTENVADNTTIAYTITGVTSGDLDGDPLTGNFTIVNNTDTITIQTADIPLNRTLTLTANSLSVQVFLLGGRKISAQYLLAAGGGGGGTDMGGGGGAGGVLTDTVDIRDGAYPVIIGGGGLGNKGIGYNASPAPGASGTNSTFNGLTALGGAGGGSGHWVPNYRGPTPPVGGSGGGGSPGGISSNPGSAGTTGQGTAGGIGLYISNYYAGGGGGAGGNAEVNGVNNSRPGIGGPGLQSSISGTSLRYGGGGGGAGHTGSGAGNGGLGGGGGGARYDTSVVAATGGTGGVNVGEAGGRAASAAGGAAGANTASGGGGGSHSTGHGGNGGGGIFIIRYAGAPRATGGTITTVDNDTVHTFTASGTFDLDIPPYQTGINVSTTSAYNGDIIEFVYVDQTAADNTTVAYTISGVTSADIDGDALTGNFTIVGGIAYLTLTATNVVNKTLTLTADGESANVSLQYAINMRYLAVAGGGGGGMDMGGGGGAGGLLKSASQRFSTGSYNIVIGAGGTGAPRAGTGTGTQGTTAHQFTIPATKGQDTVFGTVTAFGGGIGGSSYFPYTPGAAGGSGGSGGGASAYSDGSSRSGGAGVAGQGFRGGNGGPSQYYGGGGGGAGGQGVDPNSRADGGPGLEDNILGTSYHWAGGGGGSGYSIQGGNGGIGGGGGGAIGTTTGGAGLNNGSAGGGGGTGVQANTPGGNAGANTGGGGGGGSHYTATNQGGNGGSGIVVVRYSGGQKAVGGTVTTVSTDTVHTFTASGTLTVFPGEGLTSSTASAYFGDTFTVYLTANEPDSTTVPYTISGVTSAEINGASLTGNFTVTGGIASLQIVTVAGTLDTKTFSISAYGYTVTVNLTYVQSFTVPRTSSGWGINQVFTLTTRNLSNGSTVPYTITGVDSSDINSASLTGNITVTSNQGQLTVSSNPLLLTSKTLTVTIPGGFSLSVALTFITVPATEPLRPMGIDGVSVTSTEISDLAESVTTSQTWTGTFVEEHRFLSGIDGVSVIPTDVSDLAEQVTVAVSIGDMPRVDDPKEVRMVGISASPTYVYTDGAPIAAPDPSETQSIEQWTIT